jgi:hypothetical protein
MYQYNKEWQYMTVQVPYIAENIEDIKRLTAVGVDKFKRKFHNQNHAIGTENITWQFANYNVFGVCSCNQWFYEIYKSLIGLIKEYHKAEGLEVPSQLWLQSWINSHTTNQVLRTHNHDWPLHGYISIEPKKSHTVFTDKPNGKELYRIENKVGQIYLGPGYRFHHVEVLEPFEGERITFGYDLEHRDRIFDNMGFFPIIL